MMCSTCSKLMMLVTKKNCNKCQMQVYTNISVICESCSNTNKICSACLKKVMPIETIKRGCGACK